MKHIDKFSEFERVNEDFVIPVILLYYLIKTMRDNNTNYEYVSPETKLYRKHLSTDEEHIDIPWYKFRDKSKQEFLDNEKKIRPLILTERERLKKETFEFDTNTIVYDFFKNQINMSPEDKKELDNLTTRMKGMYINRQKKEKLIEQASMIYMSYLKNNSKDIRSGVLTKIKNILRGTSDDPRYPEKINIESYKPVKPNPIEPEVLKRIEAYEEDLKKIDDDRIREEERELEEWREKEKLRKAPKEKDVKTLNDFVEDYIKNNLDRIYTENKEEIEKIKSRIKPGIDITKKMLLCFRILKFYLDDLKTKDLNTVFKNLKNISWHECSDLVVGSLYYKLELNKLMGIPSGSIETEAENVQRFLKMAKNNM